MHRLGRGLPGYLILFATHAFVPQRQLWSRKPFTPPVFLLISTHFTATPGIPLFLSRTLAPQSIAHPPGLRSGRFHTILIEPPTHPLRPVTPNNACCLRITAAAGCVVNRSCFCRYRHNLPCRKELYTPKVFIAHRGVLLHQGCPHWLQDSPLLPPVGVWPVFQCQCGRVPSPGRLSITALVGHYPTN